MHYLEILNKPFEQDYFEKNNRILTCRVPVRGRFATTLDINRNTNI